LIKQSLIVANFNKLLSLCSNQIYSNCGEIASGAIINLFNIFWGKNQKATLKFSFFFFLSVDTAGPRTNARATEAVSSGNPYLRRKVKSEINHPDLRRKVKSENNVIKIIFVRYYCYTTFLLLLIYLELNYFDLLDWKTKTELDRETKIEKYKKCESFLLCHFVFKKYIPIMKLVLFVCFDNL